MADEAMVRTQIYLTTHEQRALRSLAEATGKNQSQLIRAAVDRMLAAHSGDSRSEALARAAGLWIARDDLPDLEALRREADRIQLTRK